MYACMHVCMYVVVRVCVCIYVCVCVFIYMHVYTDMCTNVHMRERAYVCTYTHQFKFNMYVQLIVGIDWCKFVYLY